MAHLIKVLIGPYTFPSPYDNAPYATGSIVPVSNTAFASIPSGDFTGTAKLQDLPLLSDGTTGGSGGPHTHPESDVTNLASDLAALATALGTKQNALPGGGTTAQYLRGDLALATLNRGAVGLGNVDNTADTAKPISDLVQAALDLKSNLGHSHAGITPPPEDDDDAVPSLRTLGTGVGQAASGVVFGNHLTELDPHAQYAHADDLLTHETTDQAHGSLNIPLTDPITGQAVSNVHDALVDIYGKLPGGSAAYEQDEPYNFPGKLTVQPGVAKYLADVAIDILHCRAIINTTSLRDISFVVKAENADLFTTVGATVRDVQFNHQNSGNSISVTKPATQTGDVVYILLQSRASDPTLATPVVPTPPSGFLPFNTLAPSANANTGRPRVYIWQKKLNTSEGSGSYSFTGLETAGKYVAITFSVKDSDPFTPTGPSIFNLGSALDTNAATSATAVVSGFTQTFNKGLDICVVAANANNAGDFNLSSTLAGWTRLAFDRGGSGYVGMAVYVRNSDTAPATPTISATKVSDGTAMGVYWAGWMFGIRPNRPCVPVSLDRSQGLYVPQLVKPHLTPLQLLSVGIDSAGPVDSEGEDAVLWVKRVPH